MVPCHDDAEDNFEDAIVRSLFARVARTTFRTAHALSSPAHNLLQSQEVLCEMAVKTTVRARVPALASADQTTFEHMSPYHNLGIHTATQSALQLLTGSVELLTGRVAPRHPAYLCRM